MKKYTSIQHDALDFLRENQVAVIATCFEGELEAAAVYYDIDDDFNVYYLTKHNTNKDIKALSNPNVAMVVGTGPEKITVQAQGKVEILSGKERAEAIDRMSVRFAVEKIKDLPMNIMNGHRDEPTVVFKFIPEKLIYMNMDSKKYPRSMSSHYHEII